MVDAPDRGESPFSPTDPDRERAARVDASLLRLAERHAGTGAARRRQDLSGLVAAHEVVRLVSLIGGGAVTRVAGEAAVDKADLVAALTLLPVARAEVEELEASLLFLARSQGMTWAQIAFAMGLRSAQAAQQRGERLGARGDVHPSSSQASGTGRHGEGVTGQSLVGRAGRRSRR